MTGKTAEKDGKAARLAEALRANLRRRKDQARARSNRGADDSTAAPSKPPAEDEPGQAG